MRSRLAVLVYGSAIVLGSAAVVPSLKSTLLVIPLLAGLLLLGHAATATRLDELGYAIIGMYAALLVASVSLGIAETVVFARDEPPIDPVGGVGTIGLTGVLVGGYAVATWYTRPEGG